MITRTRFAQSPTLPGIRPAGPAPLAPERIPGPRTGRGHRSGPLGAAVDRGIASGGRAAAPAVRWAARHSAALLRISLGAVFLLFGALKAVPGLSPAEGLVVPTLETLTLGLIAGQAAMLVTAAVECFIGVTLLTGRFLRTGLLVLAGSLVGIMSPLVLMAGDLFPGGAPTLAAQYVIKDIVLAAAALVVAVHAVGARTLAPAWAAAARNRAA